MKTANIKKEYVIHNINKNYNSRSILKFILFYFIFILEKYTNHAYSSVK